MSKGTDTNADTGAGVGAGAGGRDDAEPGKRTDLVEYEHMVLGRHNLRAIPITPETEQLLERSSYIMLSRIQRQGPMSIGQLSEAFGLDASTLNRQTAAAMRAGLLRRIPDPEGGIARKFQLTDEGARRLTVTRDWHVDGLDRVMAEWSPQDVLDFAAFLRRFNTDIERIDKRPWPRPEEEIDGAGGG
ncbi:MarR family transcriptional regulator [Actinospica durhamensis]|uniref:MarR family transcriptional regulator n=2 Tax=Actinospica durhamensis TaxID=1508375 RepID=A0A941IQL1_9ACTN|nr:MarR family transcriptional regulator [Actinospica durhamensis]MBR7837780.1 MarR family transcriptional regulator [Actinospica durhamensis]